MSKVGTADITSIMLGSTKINKAYLGSDIVYQNNVPLPYDAEIEYLQSSGTQFINLSFGADVTDEVFARFAVGKLGSDKYINSSRTWNSNNNRWGMGVHQNEYCMAFGNRTTGSGIIGGTPDGKFHNWHYANKFVEITDLGRSKDFSSIGWGGTTSTLKLFYGYNSNTACSISSYKHLKNGVAVCDFIPVRVGTTGYMYDKVSKQLFGNSGTGSFVLGPDVT